VLQKGSAAFTADCPLTGVLATAEAGALIELLRLLFIKN